MTLITARQAKPDQAGGEAFVVGSPRSGDSGHMDATPPPARGRDSPRGPCARDPEWALKPPPNSVTLACDQVGVSPGARRADRVSYQPYQLGIGEEGQDHHGYGLAGQRAPGAGERVNMEHAQKQWGPRSSPPRPAGGRTLGSLGSGRGRLPGLCRERGLRLRCPQRRRWRRQLTP
jgi:hypothetical protein